MNGKIIKIISNLYTVKGDRLYECMARGKFRNLNIKPLVGDNCLFDEQKKWLIEILPRKNELHRPLIANVDQALVVSSVKDPNLDLVLLDKLLCVIEFNNIQPIICFTKVDLLKCDKNILKIQEYYKKIGYQVFDNRNLDDLKTIFKDKVTVFAGQSGVGKSTLLNMLNNELNL